MTENKSNDIIDLALIKCIISIIPLLSNGIVLSLKSEFDKETKTYKLTIVLK